MKKILFALLFIVIFISCNSEDDNTTVIDQNFLTFGHFFSECLGETCVETFRLTETSLFEDTIDDYQGNEFKFIELNKSIFEQTKDLIDFFPDELLDTPETVFGCPDCIDGGGLFIQYSENGILRSWRIDQVKSNVPVYLHDFMDRINEKIELINSSF